MGRETQSWWTVVKSRHSRNENIYVQVRKLLTILNDVNCNGVFGYDACNTDSPKFDSRVQYHTVIEKFIA